MDPQISKRRGYFNENQEAMFHILLLLNITIKTCLKLSSDLSLYEVCIVQNIKQGK